MSSFGSGFSSGLGQGMAMGKMIMDTYNEYDTKDKLAKAGQLDQEEINAGLTPEQQAQIQQTRDQKRADGTNMYEVEDTKNGVRVRVAGDPEAQWGDVAGAKQFKLGDKTQSTAFSKDQVERARDDARAKVLMDAGDVKGAYGLRAAAREERKGQQWEDINQNQINDLQALAEGNYDKLRGTIDKGVERYNNAQSGPYADNHRISIDWNKNQAIVTGPKNEVVKTIPITQQTAAQFIRSYYDDLRSAANPEYGLKAREVGTGERKADAEVKKADAYASLVPSEINKNNAAAQHYMSGGSGGGTGGKPQVRTSTYTDDNGVKTPINVVTTFKGGVPVVQAFDMNGKPVKDQKAVEQAMSGEDASPFASGRAADLQSARKAFETNGDHKSYQASVQAIEAEYAAKESMYRFKNEFNANSKKDGRESAVRDAVDQVTSQIKDPARQNATLQTLGISTKEINEAKRKRGGDSATSYSTQSTWQPGQRRIPENMRGQ